ncbi:hypothetical protein L484_015387 [Morus notabilis]|uniref:Uncharacterized protein n=1 Tax=Morus notabilis TaxID=981085 RepID=W9RRD2_9ROSA|nr:hypothetical protein L484_015387 [Morus notabilis]
MPSKSRTPNEEIKKNQRPTMAAEKEEEVVVFKERENVRVEEEREVGLDVGVVGMRPRPPVRSHRWRGGCRRGRWSSREK